jgi:hypothetical protein
MSAVLFALGLNPNEIYPSINNFVIKDLTTKVQLSLIVNGTEYILTRISEQKFKTDKETNEKYFVGNDSVYNFDGVEMSKTNYCDRVALLFNCKYDYINMLVDGKMFNNLDWKIQRKTLFDLLEIDKFVGTLAEKPQYELLKEDLKKDKTEIDIQKMINAEKLGNEKEMQRNKILFDNKTNELAQYSGLDFTIIKAKKEKLQNEIQKMQQSSETTNKNELTKTNLQEIEKLQSQLNSKNREYQDWEYDHDKNIGAIKSKIRQTENDIEFINSKVARIESENEDLQVEIADIEKMELDKEKTVCPTCHREFETAQKEKIITEFNDNKTKSLDDMRLKVQNNAIEIENSTNRKIVLTDELKSLETQLNELNELVYDKSEIDKLKIDIDTLNIAISKSENETQDTTVSDKLIELQNEYDITIAKLYKETIFNNIKSEIQSLKNANKEIADKDNLRAKKQNVLNDYIQEKISIVNEEINKNFDGVSFSMFKLLGANASNPFENDCTCIYNPTKTIYSQSSTGQKIICDFLVGVAFRKILGVDCFVFVDERQSTTINFASESQIVELITSLENNLKISRIDQIYTLQDCIVG